MKFRKSKATAAHKARKSIKDKISRAMDTEWSLEVKVKAGMLCEYCGSGKGLQSHHVFTRSIKSTRHYLPNGVCLCAGHHFFLAHKKPHEFRDWITQKRGQEWWNKLVEEKNKKYFK